MVVTDRSAPLRPVVQGVTGGGACPCGREALAGVMRSGSLLKGIAGTVYPTQLLAALFRAPGCGESAPRVIHRGRDAAKTHESSRLGWSLAGPSRWWPTRPRVAVHPHPGPPGLAIADQRKRPPA